MNITYIKEQNNKMGKNFMTPEIINYTITPDGRIIELSAGLDLDNKKVFGVSEFILNDDKKLETTRRGQMHHTKQSARKHFNILLGSF